MIITVFRDDIQEGGGVRGILLSLWQASLLKEAPTLSFTCLSLSYRIDQSGSIPELLSDQPTTDLSGPRHTAYKLHSLTPSPIHPQVIQKYNKTRPIIKIDFCKKYNSFW